MTERQLADEAIRLANKLALALYKLRKAVKRDPYAEAEVDDLECQTEEMVARIEAVMRRLAEGDAQEQQNAPAAGPAGEQ